MTPEVAAQTRQQLPFDQAILARLGALRALSFRGVSALGSDIYIVHFANGTAEWRIGLVKDGTIGRIALGSAILALPLPWARQAPRSRSPFDKAGVVKRHGPAQSALARAEP